MGTFFGISHFEAEHCNGYPWFFFKDSWDRLKKIFITIFFRSHSSNPWKIREISKHLNLGAFQKTSNNSRNVFNVTKLFIGINAEIEKLSGDMHLVTEFLVWEAIFAIYPMDPCNALHWRDQKFPLENEKLTVLYRKQLSEFYSNIEFVCKKSLSALEFEKF
jgi:hypothetical protein